MKRHTEIAEPDHLSPASVPTASATTATSNDNSSGQPARHARPALWFLSTMKWAVSYSVVLVPVLLFVASLLGRHFLVCELICNFRAYILMGLVTSGPILWFLKNKLLTGIWTVATFWAMAGTVSVFLPSMQTPMPVDETGDTPALKIMSFNVLGTNRAHAEVVAEIRRHNPDVLVVLEFANRWQPALERLHADYPHRIEQPRWHGFGIAIFSKLPLEQETVLQIAKRRTDNPLAVAVVKVGTRRLRIAGTHLLSPMDPNRLSIRNQQIREIGQFLSSESIPTILLGDFNCVPWSAYLSDFLKRTGYRDSRQGFGYDGTWHAKRIFLRIPIDHAFVSPKVHVHSRIVGEAAGSDHFPVIVEVSVR